MPVVEHAISNLVACLSDSTWGWMAGGSGWLQKEAGSHSAFDLVLSLRALPRSWRLPSNSNKPAAIQYASAWTLLASLKTWFASPGLYPISRWFWEVSKCSQLIVAKSETCFVSVKIALVWLRSTSTIPSSIALLQRTVQFRFTVK